MTGELTSIQIPDAVQLEAKLVGTARRSQETEKSSKQRDANEEKLSKACLNAFGNAVQLMSTLSG